MFQTVLLQLAEYMYMAMITQIQMRIWDEKLKLSTQRDFPEFEADGNHEIC